MLILFCSTWIDQGRILLKTDIDFSKYRRRIISVVSLLRYRSFPIIRLFAKNNEVKRSDRSILINDRYPTISN